MPILSRGHLHLPHSRPIVRVLRRLDLDQRPEIAHFCADLLVVGGHLPLGARRGSFFMATQRLPTLRYPGIFICTGILRISMISCVTGIHDDVDRVQDPPVGRHVDRSEI